jgi:phosphoenolpyruvate carboxykinase (GTP)
MADSWEDPQGVVIDAIVMGGRRATVVPLVREALSWEQGVFMGATMSSEQTAAAEGAVGSLRFDPFAMLPFTGYHVADYFAHWLKMGERTGATLPRIFYVNWFRKDDDGRFMWPGFGENSRVLDWIVRRTEDAVDAVETPIGFVPRTEDLNVEGLDIAQETLAQLTTVDLDAVAAELPQVRAHLEGIDHLPAPIVEQLERLERATKG